MCVWLSATGKAAEWDRLDEITLSKESRVSTCVSHKKQTKAIMLMDNSRKGLQETETDRVRLGALSFFTYCGEFPFLSLYYFHNQKQFAMKDGNPEKM